MGLPEGQATGAEVIPWPAKKGFVIYRDRDVAEACGHDPGSVRISCNWRFDPMFETVILEEGRDHADDDQQ